MRERATKDPHLFFEEYPHTIIFDEIQYVPHILSYIKILVDKEPHKKGRFILTGSQQFHVMKHLSETLAGRIALLTLYPFSITEKRHVPLLHRTLTTTKKAFLHACTRGSYPQLSVVQRMDAATWYAGYVQTYLERDIRSIYNVGNLRDFQRCMQLLASRTSQMLNMSTIATDVGVSVNTIKHWISILEAGNLVYLLPPYYQNLGKRITKNPKLYFCDVGLACHLSGITSEEHILHGPHAGALFENFILQETLKWFANRGQIPRLYFLRTHNNLEIDLLIETNLQCFPIEIKLTKTPHIGMTHTFERARTLFETFNIQQGHIVCLSDETFKLSRDVSVTNLDGLLRWFDKTFKK